MAGRAVRKGALSQGLFTSWMEELTSMFTTDTKKTKSPKKLTKRAQKHRDEVANIIEEFCQVYPAARAEPTEDEIMALWERCAYFRPNYLAVAISDQLSLRDGEMDWQPRLRALCVLEHCYLERSRAPRSVGLSVCEDFRGLLEYLASDVKQCSEKAKKVLHLNSLPPPRISVAPMDMRNRAAAPAAQQASPESPPMKTGQQQYQDVAEIVPLCAADDVVEISPLRTADVQPMVPGLSDPAASDKPERDADSETTASSGEEETVKAGRLNREDLPEDGEMRQTVPDEHFKASATAAAAALMGDTGPLSPGMGNDSPSADEHDAENEDTSVPNELESLSFDPDGPVGAEAVKEPVAAPAEWSSGSSDDCCAHRSSSSGALCKDLAQAFEAASDRRHSIDSSDAANRPFLWLASVETAMPDRVSWKDPLASLNPAQLGNAAMPL